MRRSVWVQSFRGLGLTKNQNKKVFKMLCDRRCFRYAWLEASVEELLKKEGLL